MNALANMTAIDYARLDRHRLGDLLEQSKRTEMDFQDRLETWQKKLAESGDANVAPKPDPVAKRLRFLHASVRAQRRAVDRELAMRLPENSYRRDDDGMRTEAGLVKLVKRPSHEEWLIDEAIRDSFPASDPASTSQPGSIVNARYTAGEAE